MDIITTILNAAKVAKVSGTLLLAVCTHESGLKNVVVLEDKGSPSIGACQIKKGTAQLMNFKGKEKQLLKPEVNIYYSAKYLKYQMDRYNNNWVKAVAAYNAGSYRESSIMPGCPKNLKYVNLVRVKLPYKYRSKLQCTSEVAEK